MNKEQTNVKDWMSKFGQETPAKPCIPSLEIRKLRAKLILEEALETINGLEIYVALPPDIHVLDPEEIHLLYFQENKVHEPHLVLIADGLADLNYVSYGTAVACGLDMEPIEAEVHRSNMSKLWESGRKARELGYKDIRLMTDIEGGSDALYLVKDSFGKVIKSPSYSPPNLKPFIQ